MEFPRFYSPESSKWRTVPIETTTGPIDVIRLEWCNSEKISVVRWAICLFVHTHRNASTILPPTRIGDCRSLCGHEPLPQSRYHAAVTRECHADGQNPHTSCYFPQWFMVSGEFGVNHTTLSLFAGTSELTNIVDSRAQSRLCVTHHLRDYCWPRLRNEAYCDCKGTLHRGTRSALSWHQISICSIFDVDRVPGSQWFISLSTRSVQNEGSIRWKKLASTDKINQRLWDPLLVFFLFWCWRKNLNLKSSTNYTLSTTTDDDCPESSSTRLHRF